MNGLRENALILRAPEPSDLPFLIKLENDRNNWWVSGTISPWSHYTLKKYLENSGQDIAITGQQRFVLSTPDHRIGLIDFYDYDALNQRAAIGIVIDPDFRNRGYGKKAIELIIKQGEIFLGLHQVYAEIPAFNEASIRLFEKCGFTRNGVKKDWIRKKGKYHDVYFYQKFLSY
ncbi:GNAT family N-acetyltransferase [Schleiferia thermophila]|jgi:diamine N-acetyltransferase|uniref:Diamine N-acetyltransferase n=1 Tax=Schleiferia thermophila TaxID=884107 RepID=A0A368ZZA2_9FLAO|nr:GNAT family protein [Schleiferia thermophila]KFD39004.1 acetyltransferase [Schleiferia thermophila str. Yellowstone]RCX02352.1 diamine N-acetyltransferase [Schleiferia thermophila]GCD80764.1 spermidine N1-acetyltransferase [Schleiferia thermophila]